MLSKLNQNLYFQQSLIFNYTTADDWILDNLNIHLKGNNFLINCDVDEEFQKFTLRVDPNSFSTFPQTLT